MAKFGDKGMSAIMIQINTRLARTTGQRVIKKDMLNAEMCEVISSKINDSYKVQVDEKE